MRKVLFICIISLTLFSCSKEDIEDDLNSNDSVLVKKIVHSREGTTNYFYHGNKLDRIVSEFGIYAKFTYTGSLITKIELFDNNNVSTWYEILIYTNNKLIQSQDYEDNVLTSSWNYIYNSDGSKSVIHVDAKGNPTNSVNDKYYYDEVGHCTKIEQIFRNEIIATNYYTYDNANNPYKNITGYGYYWNYVNNIIKERTVSSNTSQAYENFRTYIYNSQGYPISCTESESGTENVTIQYFY